MDAPKVVTVSLHESSRLLRDWPGRWAGARKYAREHNAAGVLRADASYVLFYMDAGMLRQKTFPQVRIARV